VIALTYEDAVDRQAEELARTLDLLRSLDEQEWSAPTDCPAWDVRRMYLHVLGACEAGARVRENARQLAAALRWRRREGGPLEAAVSGVQVREREHLSPRVLMARLADVAPATVRARRRLPAPARRYVRIPVDGPVRETWTLGYLAGTIYLRDLWMHRVDAARATGRPLVLTADHDGRIVADVVAEWARRHARPFVLELGGEAGGRYESDPGAGAPERLEMDAVEFCRTLAGREEGKNLLATVVPF
jgi:uncharacterized protein (TIGR03083 family)